MSTPEPPASGAQPTPDEATAPPPRKRPAARSAGKPAEEASVSAPRGGRQPAAPRTPKTTTPKSTDASGPAAGAQPAAVKPAAVKADAVKPAAVKPDARSKTPAAKRLATTPAATRAAVGAPKTAKTPTARARKTPSTPPARHDGEAPEILDAVLGTRGSAADTSTSPAEPLKTEDAPTVAQPADAEPTVVLPADAEPTVVLPVEAPVGIPETAPAGGAPRKPTAGYTASEQPGTERPPTEQPSAANPAAPGYPAPTYPAPQPGSASTPGIPPATVPAGATPSQTGYPRSVVDLADRIDDSRFFSSLFDFSFTSYVTRKLAGPVYVVGLVLIGLAIVVGFSNSLSAAIATHSPVGAFVFLFGVLLTLVGAMLSVLLLRVAIEVFVAIIEIAQNTRRRKRRD